MTLENTFKHFTPIKSYQVARWECRCVKEGGLALGLNMHWWGSQIDPMCDSDRGLEKTRRGIFATRAGMKPALPEALP